MTGNEPTNPFSNSTRSTRLPSGSSTVIVQWPWTLTASPRGSLFAAATGALAAVGTAATGAACSRCDTSRAAPGGWAATIAIAIALAPMIGAIASIRARRKSIMFGALPFPYFVM